MTLRNNRTHFLNQANENNSRKSRKNRLVHGIILWMAKQEKRKKRAKKDEDEREPRISSDALRSVAAVLLVASAVFLILAAFSVGGWFGESVYSLLSTLLGVGYMLLPLSLVLLAVAIIRSFEGHFGAVQVVSMLVFFLSALGLVNLGLPTR
jgi:hypothetical protein